MRNLFEIKSNIEEKKNIQLPIIFIYSDCKFIAEQYIKEISKIMNLPVEYIEELGNNDSISLFDVSSDTLQVLITDELTSLPKMYLNINLVIVTKKVIDNRLEEYTCIIPKLEKDWIKDYLYSNMEGIDIKALDKLFDDSSANIYRLDNEIQKLSSFTDKERKILFERMIDDQCFSDISKDTIFDFSNALLKKDLQSLCSLFRKIGVIDCEPLGLITILYQNFRKYIQVWLSKNATEENTGIKRNAIYAISKQPRVYNKQQLIDCFKFLCNIDKELKTGNIETSWLVDYTVCKILTT